MGTNSALLKRLSKLEELIRFQHRRTFVGPYTVSHDREIQARSDADLDKLKEQLGVTDRDVCVLIKHFYRLKDDTGSYYATDADAGKYQLPTLSLAYWHAQYDLIFPGDAA
jgi:hypothetical protein